MQFPKKATPENTPKKVGRPRKVTAEKVENTNTTHIDAGTYEIYDAEMVHRRKFRLKVSDNGVIGGYNIRLEIVTNMLTGDENETLILQTPNATFLRARDDAWREENNSENKNSGVKVEEIHGYKIENGKSNLEEIWCKRKNN